MSEPQRGVPAYLRVLGLLAVGFAVGRVTAPTPAPVVAPAVNSAAPSETRPVDVEVAPETPAGELTEDERLFRGLVGVWTAQSHGTQVCTLNADGTGTNKADLDWMASLVYGKRLDMNITWAVEDGHLVQTLLGGEPADMVQKLMNDYGAVRRYRIDSLDAQTGVLVDTADGETTVWTSAD